MEVWMIESRHLLSSRHTVVQTSCIISLYILSDIGLCFINIFLMKCTRETIDPILLSCPLQNAHHGNITKIGTLLQTIKKDNNNE